MGRPRLFVGAEEAADEEEEAGGASFPAPAGTLGLLPRAGLAPSGSAGFVLALTPATGLAAGRSGLVAAVSGGLATSNGLTLLTGGFGPFKIDDLFSSELVLPMLVRSEVERDFALSRFGESKWVGDLLVGTGRGFFGDVLLLSWSSWLRN